jgi:O-antigen ligase
MSGHWLIGYGHATEEAAMASADWGGRIDGRYRVDMVNEYLLILFRYGFIALIPFLAMIYATIKKLIEAWRMSLLDADKWMIWCLAASFAGLLIGFCTTSLHAGQPTILFFILLGLCGVMPLIISDNNNIMSKRRLTFQYETPDYQIST